MYVNHLDKFLKVILNETDTSVWQWPPTWHRDDKIKFINEAIEYLEHQEMYEECTKLHELKKTV